MAAIKLILLTNTPQEETHLVSLKGITSHFPMHRTTTIIQIQFVQNPHYWSLVPALSLKTLLLGGLPCLLPLQVTALDLGQNLLEGPLPSSWSRLTSVSDW